MRRSVSAAGVLLAWTALPLLLLALLWLAAPAHEGARSCLHHSLGCSLPPRDGIALAVAAVATGLLCLGTAVIGGAVIALEQGQLPALGPRLLGSLAAVVGATGTLLLALVSLTLLKSG